MKCTKCGKEIAGDSDFCEFCGAEVIQNQHYKKLFINAWFLPYALLLAICLTNFLFFEIYSDHLFYPDYPHFKIAGWWATPILSLLITIGCVVVTIKHKQSVFHAIAPSLILIMNICLVTYAAGKENDCVQRIVIDLEITNGSDKVFSFDGFGYGSTGEYDGIEQSITSQFNEAQSDYIISFSHHYRDDYGRALAEVDDLLNSLVCLEIVICLLSLVLVWIWSKKGRK